MLSPDQYRQEAREYVVANLPALCAEMVSWVDAGVLGAAPCFRALTEKCNLFAGLTYGRQAAENYIKHEAMRAVSVSRKHATVT